MYKIITVLPASEDTLLNSANSIIRILQLIVFYYQEMARSINQYSLGNYSCFDAQVSENLCQLRACKFLFYRRAWGGGSLNKYLHEINRKIIICKNKLSKLNAYKNKRIFCEMNNREMTLSLFLEESDLDCYISAPVFFIFQMYILSKYKVEGDLFVAQGIDYNKLFLDTGISSKTYLKKSIHKLQRNLSQLSCDFVFGLAGREKNKYQEDLLRLLYHRDEVGRHVVGCYESTKVLLRSLRDIKENIKIRVFRSCLTKSDEVVFNLSIDSGGYELSKKGINNSPSLVFIGVCEEKGSVMSSESEYISLFMKIGFEEIILANMAQHSQYSGLLLTDLKINPYVFTGDLFHKDKEYMSYVKNAEAEFLIHKKTSSDIGCSIHNKKLFLLKHVLYSEETVRESLVEVT